MAAAVGICLAENQAITLKGSSKMLTFQFKGKKYHGTSALDVVRALEGDAEDYPHRGQSVQQFLQWSLERLNNKLPPRDLDLSDRLYEEALALSYLYLRDEYGAGRLSVSKKSTGVPGTQNGSEAAIKGLQRKRA